MRRKISVYILCTMLLLSGCGNTKKDSKNENNKTDITTEVNSYSSSENDTSKEDTSSEDEADDTSEDNSSGQGFENYKYMTYAGMGEKEIVSKLTLEQKANQMVQPAVYNVNEALMKENCYGSILSKINDTSYKNWQRTIKGFQQMAIESEAGIPFIFGQDDVHGVNYCEGAVMFPHNIGLGAANDPELMYHV